MIPTSTNVTINVKDAAPANSEAIVVFTTEDAGVGGDLAVSDADRSALDRLISAAAVKGKAKEIVIDVVEISSGKFRRLIVVGLGKPAKVTTETLRQAAGRVIKSLKKNKLSRAGVVVPQVEGIETSKAAEALVNGAMLASFEFEEYYGTGRKKEDEAGERKLELTLIASTGDAKSIREAAERGQTMADGQNFARTIASRPANNINPPTLAKVAQEMARDTGIACRILDEKEMKKLGMGGILAVGSGSIQTPPRMIVLDYNGTGGKPAAKTAKSSGSKSKAQAAKSATLLVVGKAITFDTGGISIKPADKMGKMIFDKCGAMAVLGMMYAVAKLKLPIHLVGILASAENAISSQAYRPGDILRMYNGVTVDVTNTDAEGRLVLGDALAWGIETYKPAAVLDLATLTGGVVVALGKSIAGIMANDDKLVEELGKAADTAGEKIWRLPLNEDLRDYIRGDAADIVNSGGREGHPLQGGAFLSFFVPEGVPWCHLDIAGVADTEKELPYYAKGATGWGVRTLVEWVEGRTAK